MQPAAMLVSKIGNSPWDDFRAVGSSLLSAVVPAECKTGQNKPLKASCKGIKQAVDCAVKWNRQTQHPDPGHCITGYSQIHYAHDGHAGSEIAPSAKLQAQWRGKHKSEISMVHMAVHNLMPKLSEAPSKHY